LDRVTDASSYSGTDPASHKLSNFHSSDATTYKFSDDGADTIANRLAGLPRKRL
jgi:hypothetical protein